MYALLDLIQTGIFWIFLMVLPAILLLILFIGGKWLMRSFLNTFDKRYHLTDIIPTDINVFERGKKYEEEVADGKARILNALARYYLKPYWTNSSRRKNAVLIEKYREAADPYFLACCELLEVQKTKCGKLIENLNYKVLDNGQFFNKKDLAKFLYYDRLLRYGGLGLALTLIAVISYKYIIPGLKHYYLSLMWGY